MGRYLRTFTRVAAFACAFTVPAVGAQAATFDVGGFSVPGAYALSLAPRAHRAELVREAPHGDTAARIVGAALTRLRRNMTMRVGTFSTTNRSLGVALSNGQNLGTFVGLSVRF